MAAKILGKKDVLEAQNLQHRLAHEYLPFYKNLLKIPMLPAEQKDAISKTHAKIQLAQALIGRVFLGVGITAASVTELGKLNRILQEINEVHENIVLGVVSNQILETARDLTGVSAEELNMSIRISRKARKQARRQERRRGGGFGAGLPTALLKAIGLTPAMAAEAAVLSQFTAPILGPYMALGALYPAAVALGRLGIGGLKLGFGAGKLGLRATRETIKLGHKRHEETGGLSDMLGGIDDGIENFSGGMTKSIAPLLPPEVTNDPKTWPRDARGRWVSRSGKVSPEKASDPLFYFYDKRAHKASWTRELLSQFKGDKAKRGGVFGGLLSGLSDKFGLLGMALIPLIGKAGLIVGLGVAIGIATKKIYDAGKDLIDRLDAERDISRRVIESRSQFLSTKLEKDIEAIQADPSIPESEKWKHVQGARTRAELDYLKTHRKQMSGLSFFEKVRRGYRKFMGTEPGVLEGMPEFIPPGITPSEMESEIAPGGASLELPNEMIEQNKQVVSGIDKIVAVMTKVNDTLDKKMPGDIQSIGAEQSNVFPSDSMRSITR
jgi:hypothetical protein